jgi:hypothetical protein
MCQAHNHKSSRGKPVRGKKTRAQQYVWLNDIVCVGSGYLVEGGIAYNVSEIV